jgi:hypothetical protein
MSITVINVRVVLILSENTLDAFSGSCSAVVLQTEVVNNVEMQISFAQCHLLTCSVLVFLALTAVKHPDLQKYGKKFDLFEVVVR